MTAGLKPEKEKRDRVLQMKFDEDVVTPHSSTNSRLGRQFSIKSSALREFID